MSAPLAAARRLAPLALVAALLSAPANAAEGVGCTLSTTSLAFGRYVPSRNAPLDFTATISLSCSAQGQTAAPVEGTIALLGPSARSLTGGQHRIRYQLFMDPARTIPWGDGSGNTSTKAISGMVGPTTPMRATFTVYGRVLARQSHAEVGSYSDRITVVLSY